MGIYRIYVTCGCNWLSTEAVSSCYLVLSTSRTSDLSEVLSLYVPPRNWHPSVERTATGYYKNLALRQRVDPFTGEMTGSAAAAGSARAEARTEVS